MKLYEYSEYSEFLHVLKPFSSTVCWLSLCGQVTSRITYRLAWKKRERKIILSYLLFQDTYQKQYRSDYQLPNYDGYPQSKDSHWTNLIIFTQSFQKRLIKCLFMPQIHVFVTITEKFIRKSDTKPYWHPKLFGLFFFFKRIRSINWKLISVS